MLSRPHTFAQLGVLLLSIEGAIGNENAPETPCTTETSTVHELLTVVDTSTIISSMTHYVDVTKYVDVTVTETSTATKSITESTTTTLHYTVSTTYTETDSTTVTNTETDSKTITNTETDSATITNTETDSKTITNTETDSTTVTNTATTTTTSTVAATITTFTTTTLLKTAFDPCPTYCSLSVDTVNLFFWPTNRPYTYPSTYVDTALAYTFTSPSVYMLIPTAVGLNSASQRDGPATTSWILPLNIYDVSTIVSGSITTQITISDLGTACPQTADPSAIASLVDPACDPILAAPKAVSSWAYPCNACGRFGLFDPPYAVPTITGGLLATTTVTATPPPTSPPVGVLLVIYYDPNGDPMATATIPSTGITGTVTSSVFAVSSTAAVATSSSSAPPVVVTPSVTPSVTTTAAATSTFSPTTVATAGAGKVGSGLVWVLPSVVVALFLL